jgi:hypothetical protein
MSTRGFVGFVADGQEKIAYNHFDSYPDGLGVAVLEWLHKAGTDIEAIKARAVALRVVTTDTDPVTDADIEALRPWTNTEVGGHKDRPDWYQLLRETQGNPEQMLAAGVIEDAHEFPLDSLFAEWGYVVDFDAGVFEVYQGFQEQPHDRGRFADREPTLEPRTTTGARTWYPCALVASWPLGKLPDKDAFRVAAEPPEEDEE